MLVEFTSLASLESQRWLSPKRSYQKLVALIYRVRPQVVWDIVCEECPENLCYHTNEIERGHKNK